MKTGVLRSYSQELCSIAMVLALRYKEEKLHICVIAEFEKALTKGLEVFD